MAETKGAKAEAFRVRVLEAAQRTTETESVSVRTFAKELGAKHEKALGLISRDDYSALRAGLAAFRKMEELEVALARMIAVAARLESLVQAGAGETEPRYADEELAP